MPKSVQSNGKVAAKDMLGVYAEYSAKWFESSGATRAQHRRRLNQIALDLRLHHGLRGGTTEQVEAEERDYVSFVAPSTVKVTYD